jgi:hypothetical protein
MAAWISPTARPFDQFQSASEVFHLEDRGFSDAVGSVTPSASDIRVIRDTFLSALEMEIGRAINPELVPNPPHYARREKTCGARVL